MRVHALGVDIIACIAPLILPRQEPCAIGRSGHGQATFDAQHEPSTSQERYTWRSDLTVAWNVLDFGVSYVRAKQQADEVLIARERRTKAMQDILVDVRGTFYRGVAAQRLRPQVDELQAQGREALERSRGMDREQLLDPDVALAYQRSMLEKLDELAELRRELEVARTRIYESPDKYVRHVYGEHEAGGRSWLYLSAVPFDQLGFRTDIATTGYPTFAKEFLYAVPQVDVLKAAAAAICTSCGVVSSVKAVTQQGEGSGLGAVAGDAGRGPVLPACSRTPR